MPSAAIRRRVELAAAERFGICANVRFSFLAQWLWRQIGHVVPVSEMSPFTTPVLTWRVLGIFDEQAFVAAHPPLAGYLRHADDVMRYELAARTATLLEHYLTYRPDWLAAWLAGKPARIENLDAARRDDERWQAALWRRIAGDLGTDSRHPSVVFFDAMKADGARRPGARGAARRGARLLPADHAAALPRHPAPPRAVDRPAAVRAQPLPRILVRDRRPQAPLLARAQKAAPTITKSAIVCWPRGASRRRRTSTCCSRTTARRQVDDAGFAPSEGDTLLAQVQNAMLDLTDLARGSVELASDDRSIEVHVCHSTDARAGGAAGPAARALRRKRIRRDRPTSWS